MGKNIINKEDKKVDYKALVLSLSATLLLITFLDISGVIPIALISFGLYKLIEHSRKEKVKNTKVKKIRDKKSELRRIIDKEESDKQVSDYSKLKPNQHHKRGFIQIPLIFIAVAILTAVGVSGSYYGDSHSKNNDVSTSTDYNMPFQKIKRGDLIKIEQKASSFIPYDPVTKTFKPISNIQDKIQPTVVKDNNLNENPITDFMEQGMEGEDVCVLQKILKKENVFDNAITCYYGSVTHWAVSGLVNKYGYFQTPDNFGKIDKTALDLINQLYSIDKDGSIVKNVDTDIKVAELTFQDKIRPVVQNQDKKSYTLDEILEKETQDKTNPSISQKDIDLFNKSKNELEEVYTAIEIRKLDLKTELKYLDNIDHLTFIISTIDDCSVTIAPLLAEANTLWDSRIEELKRIYQKNIDRRRAYGGFGVEVTDDVFGVGVAEKELTDKIKEKEKSREIDLNSIRANCSDSLKNSLKDTLHTLKRDISEISGYTNSYLNLQKEIEIELEKIGTAQEKMKEGQDIDIDSVYSNYSQKITKTISQFNSINSKVESKVNWTYYTYSKSVDNAFETESIMQSIKSNVDSIQDKAQVDYENWQIKNTPVKCWSDTNYSGGLINGKSETSIRCETGDTPLRCWSTTEYKGGINGTSNTSIRCE